MKNLFILFGMISSASTCFAVGGYNGEAGWDYKKPAGKNAKPVTGYVGSGGWDYKKPTQVKTTKQPVRK